MKTNYVARAIRFMNTFLTYFDDINNQEFVIRQAVNRFNRRYNRKVVLKSGSCRHVLISSDYVIKWDYNPNACKAWGGCEDELKGYLAAVEDGYSHLFAKITPVEIQGHKFYVMPRIKNVGNVPDYIERLLSTDEMDYLSDNFMDLHEQNYGSMNGKVVVVDYASNNF